MIGNLLSSKELHEYLLKTSVYPREHELLKELRDLSATHPLGYYATEPEAGQMLALLLEITNAKKTIEVGVFTGYSLLLTALTIPKDGKIIAIDPDKKAYEFGLPVIQKSGVGHKINFINSMALPVLDQLIEKPGEVGSFDFAYVDADKENYAKYHERMLKLVKPGGLIVYDNTLWLGTVVKADEEIEHEEVRRQVPMVKAFNNLIASDDRVGICHIATGDGMTICRRL